jgi:ATP-dependent HslUV protease ATP-binding subunit HslU
MHILPIPVCLCQRISLKPLTRADIVRILTEPEFNLIRQQIELLATERIKVNPCMHTACHALLGYATCSSNAACLCVCVCFFPHLSRQLTFNPDAVEEIARVTAEVNAAVENIGARRLHAVIERLMEEISFDAYAAAH